jgi:hypothetical protein
MRALRIHAGPRALAHLAEHGLRPQDVGAVPAAAGGPKGLILGPLDRFVFGQWLPQSRQPVHLVGASIGAWRMATACLDDPEAALQALEDAYIRQHYEVPPGKKRPPAEQVSELFSQNLQTFYAGRVCEVLHHPRYRLHLIAARGRHMLGREHPLATPVGYLGAFLSNALHRKALGAWLERVVFSSPMPGPGGVAHLPFGTADFRTRQVALTDGNFMAALQASCSIPFVLRAVPHIDGAPRGAYWDGGLTDYHMHLQFNLHQDAMDNVAASALRVGVRANFGMQPDAADVDADLDKQKSAGLVLYPHFQRQVVPGWLDKALRWRHKSTQALESMIVLCPDPEWVKTLPHAKLPDRQDFVHYGHDLPGRMRAWQAATRAAQQLADEFAQWLERPDMRQVSSL